MSGSSQPSFISTAEAASRLIPAVGAPTVVNMIKDRRLRGSRVATTKRSRWTVELDSDGYLVAADGTRPHQQTPPSEPPDLAEVLRRLEALERAGSRSEPIVSDERYRDVALVLQATLEKQRQAMKLQTDAMKLQTDATQLLNDAMSEQGEIISGLLLPDSVDSPSGREPTLS